MGLNQGIGEPIQKRRVREDGTLATQYRVPVVSATAGVLTQSALQVNGTDMILVAETSSAPFGYFRNYYGDANAGGFRFQKARGSQASPAAIQQYDSLGNFQAFGYVNGAFRQLASLQFVTIGAPSGNNCQTIGRWYMNDGATGMVQSCDFKNYGIALPSANRIECNRFDSLAGTDMDFYYAGATKVFVVSNGYTRNNGYGMWVSQTASQPANSLINYQNDANAAAMSLTKARGTEGSPAAVQNADVLGTYLFNGYVNGAFRQLAMIRGQVAAAPSGNNAETLVRFSVNDGSTGLVDVFDVKKSGIVMASGKTVTGGLDLQPRTYASIYVHANSTGQSIPNAEWTQLTQFATDGEYNDCTVDVANDKITFTRTGIYLVHFAGSFTSATATSWFVQGYLDGAGLNQLRGAMYTAGAIDFQTAGFCGVIDVSSAPLDLDVRTYHGYGSAVTLVMREAQLSVMRIGDT